MAKPEFYPPKHNPFLICLGNSIAPFAARYIYQINLKISATDLEKLLLLKQERSLLLLNHPTLDDWIVIYLLSTRMGKAFYYMAAYESFQGLMGVLMQRFGVYSIKRGVGDRQSIAQTMEILMKPDSSLVVFPEGGCSYQNDTVMPFRSGAIQLTLQAMNKLVKRGEPIPNLYIIPLSLKYRYGEDANRIVEKTLELLEKELEISPVSSDFYQRLRAVSEKILVNLEREYDLYSEDIASLHWNQRIARLRSAVIEICEQKLGIVPPPHAPLRERVYKVQYVLTTNPEIQDYQSIYRATVRLLNFDAIYDGYVAASPTSERFLDTLIRLEREVFKIDQPPPKALRNATISVGDPINLKDYFEAYKQNRTETIENLTQQIQGVIQKNLDLLNEPTPREAT